MRAAYIAYALVVWPVRRGRVTLTGDSMSEPCDEGALLVMTKPTSNADTQHALSQPVGTAAATTSSVPPVRQMRFAALPTAPRMARVLVESAASAWDMKEDAVETAKLLVSELATNAVKQTGRAVGAPTPGPTENVAVIYVRLELHAEVLRLAVWDNDTAAPTLQTPTDDAESGRGLLLVETLALRWGHYSPSAGGKVVWADVTLAEAATTAQADSTGTWWPSLPKRLPRESKQRGSARVEPHAGVAMLERELWSLQPRHA